MGLFVMPSLGSDMDSGTLAEWLIKPGDTVRRGDVVAVVETQKGAIEVEVFEDGIVEELRAVPGQTLAVGAPMALIRAEEPSPPKPDQEAPSPPPAAETPVTSETPAPVTTDATRTRRVRVSPAARKAAEGRGIDPETLSGSGPGGSVVLADVEAAVGHTGAPSGQRFDPAEMRKAVAAAMTRSKQEIPHFYVSQTISIDRAARWLKKRNASRPPDSRILLGAVFAKAAAGAAERVPALNGHFSNGVFQPSEPVHVGMAIALRGGGLVAPALADVGARTLEDVMDGLRDLVVRARAGRLRVSELTRGTLTVTYLGDTGAEAMTGVIFPPQVAMVAIGAPQTRPWVTGDAISPTRVVTVTVSADHRVCDGRQASKFLAEFDALIQKPEAL